MHAFGTLFRASLAGSAIASVGGFLVPALLDASGSIASRISDLLWASVFVFMITLTELGIVTLVLLALLAILRRSVPLLLARELFPTVLCMTLGAALTVGLVYLFAATLPSEGREHVSSGLSLMLLFLAIGGAVAGMIVARREAPPRSAGG